VRDYAYDSRGKRTTFNTASVEKVVLKSSITKVVEATSAPLTKLLI
jgi:hypothetical protein